MSSSMKVAVWEIKKNLTNKSFIISMLLTPVMMFLFGALPTLLGMLESDRLHTVYLIDEIGLYDALDTKALQNEVELILYDGSRIELEEHVRDIGNASYIIIDQQAADNRVIPLYTAHDGIPNLGGLHNGIQFALQERKLADHGISAEVIALLTGEYVFPTINLEAADDNWTRKAVPAVFAGMILVAVSITGSMTFQSAVQEKKDKMAEVLLSSITPGALMQGKIIGYFVLGLVQIFVWIGFGIPIAQWYFKISVLQYLWIPELGLMLFYALIGYLMYSALFVSIGATVEDIQEAGNFQGMLFILPWLPMFFIGAIIANPSGIVALIGSYFPLSAPGVMLFRLALMNRIPVLDVLISSAVLIVFTWFVVKLAGKIFKTGILLYGKTATPKEILKWLQH